jgi:hypothetical protein
MKTFNTHLRIQTPDFFSNIDALKNGQLITTIKEAEMALKEFGDVPPTSEHYEYWKGQRAKCKIVKVTTIIDEDIESKNNYESFDYLIDTLKDLQWTAQQRKNKGGKFLQRELNELEKIDLAIKKATT